MYELLQTPEWIGTALIGAVIATLGYVGKIFAEFWIGLRETKNIRRARLVELRSLLRATKVSFTVQNDHAHRLLSMIKENHPAFSRD